MTPEELGYYEKGETTYFALGTDQRFGYCLYVPPSFSPERADAFELAAIIHGSARTPHVYRSLFKGFAERYGCVVLAPMFPSRIFVEGEEANYKFLRCHDIRFDRLLLQMIDEVRSRYHLRADHVLMHGFSGGGHFAHRFFYLHPERLMGVSIGAPGMVTLLAPELDWHCGTRGMETVFGQRLDVDAMRRVPVQMVIGAEDTETREIMIEPDEKLSMPGVNDAGRTRLERLAALRESFETAGIDVRYDVVPGVGHHGYDLLAPVKDFFASTLAEYRPPSVHTEAHKQIS